MSGTITLYDLWQTVLNGYVDDGLHPSKAYLEHLITDTGGVPDFALWYVQGLETGTIRRPRGRTARYLETWEVKWLADMGLPVDLPAAERFAVEHVRILHARLKAWRTRSSKIGKCRTRFRWVKIVTDGAVEWGLPLRRAGSGTWRISEPLLQARRLVAKRFEVRPDQVREWERRGRRQVPTRQTLPAGPLQAPLRD